jgi:phosphinothricin acetyltransferase
LGEVLGWAELKTYSPRAGYSRCAETSVYVHPCAQGQGVGAQLLQQLIAKAQDLGYVHLVAKVVAGNDHSIRFHQRFGYECVGIQRRIGYLRGRWYDVTILQRLLQADPELINGT